jgi:hypothetical protein
MPSVDSGAQPMTPDPPDWYTIPQGVQSFIASSILVQSNIWKSRNAALDVYIADTWLKVWRHSKSCPRSMVNTPQTIQKVARVVYLGNMMKTCSIPTLKATKDSSCCIHCSNVISGTRNCWPSASSDQSKLKTIARVVYLGNILRTYSNSNLKVTMDSPWYIHCSNVTRHTGNL